MASLWIWTLIDKWLLIFPGLTSLWRSVFQKKILFVNLESLLSFSIQRSFLESHITSCYFVGASTISYSTYRHGIILVD